MVVLSNPLTLEKTAKRVQEGWWYHSQSLQIVVTFSFVNILWYDMIQGNFCALGSCMSNPPLYNVLSMDSADRHITCILKIFVQAIVRYSELPLFAIWNSFTSREIILFFYLISSSFFLGSISALASSLYEIPPFALRFS